MRMLNALTLAVILLASSANAGAQTSSAVRSPAVAVAPQYDTTHVYVAAEDFDRFVTSFLATFGGSTSKQGVATVTPTPSSTVLQMVFTPVGTLSVFGFTTPVPYPFGSERTGYLVTDLGAAVRAARASGADVIVAPQRSDRPRCHRAVAGRRQHAALLAHDGSELRQAANHSRKPGLRLARPRRRLHPQLCRLLRRHSRGRRCEGTRRRDRPAQRDVPARPHRIDVRQGHGARHRWPSALPVRTRADRLRGARRRYDCDKGEACRRARVGRTLFGRRPAVGLRAIPRWLYRRNSCDSSQVMRRPRASRLAAVGRSEEHTSELQSHSDLVCRLLLEKKKSSSTPSNINDSARSTR